MGKALSDCCNQQENPAYPTKQAMALTLLADALYATNPFMEQAAKLFDTQVISQLHKNQNVRFRNKLISLEKYFTHYPGVPQNISIRGDEEVGVLVSSARLYVDAHHQKRFVIALKYEKETEYRYLVASELTWRTLILSKGIHCVGPSR